MKQKGNVSYFIFLLKFDKILILIILLRIYEKKILCLNFYIFVVNTNILIKHKMKSLIIYVQYFVDTKLK